MTVSPFITPVLGFAAPRANDRTQLVKTLLPLLCERGLCVGVLWQTEPQFELDKPGRDSFDLRQAGAQQLLVTSSQRWALLVEREFEHEPRLEEHLAHFEHDTLDLILIASHAPGRFPRIELHRPTHDHRLMFGNDASIIAVASDSPLILPDHIDCLNLNDHGELVRYIAYTLLPEYAERYAELFSS
ncbi:MAG: molybdopterin-guanine dinucleotide biosynthesis protein MobB [Gammaproteobacteria bacterium]|nr:molybdopterin-guanine dinucleotide biosynthesis protein MobB [Gammaproteobacteria bacterium]